MATMITVPDSLEVQLQQHAHAQHRSVEAVALDLLREALNAATAAPSVNDVVATIKATAPNPSSIRPARGSIADILRRTPSTVDVDLDQWNQDWAAVEQEMRAMTRADDRAEGHG
jgi:plasmid stability protein